MKDEGCTFFFLAEEMKATTLRIDREKAFATGLRRLAERTKALRCNSFEISRVTNELFLGSLTGERVVPRASSAAAGSSPLQ
jgi:hypothetical protein